MNATLSEKLDSECPTLAKRHKGLSLEYQTLTCLAVRVCLWSYWASDLLIMDECAWDSNRDGWSLSLFEALET